MVGNSILVIIFIIIISWATVQVKRKCVQFQEGVLYGCFSHRVDFKSCSQLDTDMAYLYWLPHNVYK